MVYLISPILMMAVYAQTERGVFMTFIGNTYLGIGNLLLAFIFAYLIYILFEFQVKRLIEIFIVEKYLSHDQKIRDWHFDQQRLTKFAKIVEA